ncbi:MAG: DUF72 domain-containing protein [Bacteroidota bacterium]|nr:DUF72 domain-containing protein [Bacteroidota bacterium]
MMLPNNQSTKIYIGCSGFHYKEWKDFFYPEKLPLTKWFQYYCEHFNTLELNVTFYKFPTEKSLSKWFNSSPDDFKFSVKAPRLITHYKKFNDCESLLKDFYTSISAGLQQKLGCVLFQFPPHLIYTPEILDLIINSVDPSFQNVFEFRHASWWDENVFEQFKNHNLIFCGSSFPKLPDEAIATTQNLYYRFHGVPVLYKSVYEENFVENIYGQIKNANPAEAWIYFNNTWGNAAIINSRQLQKLAASL